MDCSPPGSSAHGILQARILEGVATSFSRGSSQTRDLCVSCVSCIGRRLPYDCTTWEAPDSRLQRDTKLDSSFCCNRAEPCPSSRCPKVPLCPLPLIGRKAGLSQASQITREQVQAANDYDNRVPGWVSAAHSRVVSQTQCLPAGDRASGVTATRQPRHPLLHVEQTSLRQAQFPGLASGDRDQHYCS